tara:strand:- start:270 stop:539 length:270 start_codon:yes stop_codon:yes gene_type:complete
MFSKIKKYVIGFFVLCGGVLAAFLTGRSAGKKDEKLKGIKEDVKKVKDIIKDKKKNIKKTKKRKYKPKNVGTKEAADYLKKFANKGKKK